MGDGTEKRGRAGRPGKLVGSFNRQGLTADVEVPVGVERVLLRAAADADFRNRLLSDPTRALEEPRLTRSERALLEALSPSMLAHLLDRLDPPGRKGRFAMQVAAAVAGTVILTASAACTKGGAAPDDDDTDSYSDTDSDSDSDTDTYTDSDTDSDTDPGTDSDTATATDTGS